MAPISVRLFSDAVELPQPLAELFEDAVEVLDRGEVDHDLALPVCEADAHPRVEAVAELQRDLVEVGTACAGRGLRARAEGCAFAASSVARTDRSSSMTLSARRCMASGLSTLRIARA